LLPLVSLSPALGAFIGAVLATHFTWKASFIFVGSVAFSLLFFVLFYFPESKPKEHRLAHIKLKTLWSSLVSMFTNRRFLRASLATTTATSCWWIYVAGAPLMFHRMGLSTLSIGLLYFPAVLPYMGFSFVARSLLKRKSSDQISRMGMNFLFLTLIPIFLCGVFHWVNLWAIVILMTFISSCNGILLGMAMGSAIDEFRQHSGLATGTIGTVQLFAGFIGSFCVQMLANNFSSYVFVWTEFALILFLTSLYYLCFQRKD
jgi:predicted MFS family arabinose efflux permease